MTRELGFMEQTLAATPYPPSTVHALIEIDRTPGITAAELADELLLDRSTVSRLLRRLVDADEIREDLGETDRRHKTLSLTGKGRQTVRAIHRHGTAQVESAFAHLAEPEQEAVRRGLRTYAEALVHSRLGHPLPGSRAAIEVDTELRPGDVGQIAVLHAREYAEIAGFGVAFEAVVAGDLAEFVRRDDPADRIWIARDEDGTVVGSIAVELSHGPREAHLRWFLVGRAARGTGLGRRLLNDAVAYCDAGGAEATALWTFQGLDTARAMYEKHGFALVSEQSGDRWGNTVVEQLFRRPARAGLSST
ncbi:GNAT family N-acetyltransferase [Streptomyces sp. NPDC002623]